MVNQSGIDLSSPDPNWKLHFEEEAKIVRSILQDNLIAVYHIGSTAIPGLAAKPIIDLLGVARNIDQIDLYEDGMRQAGYEILGECGMPGRRFFIKKTNGKRSHNLHIFDKDNDEINRHLLFRDYLRAHPEELELYAELKENLTKTVMSREAYTEGKEKFIQAIDQKSGYHGYRMVLPLSQTEIAAYNQIAGQYFKEGVLSQPQLPSQPIQYLILYRDVEVIGAAWLESKNGKRKAHIGVVKGGREAEEKFRTMMTRWRGE